MANTVGQFQQASFTSPAYGDSPISSSVVRGNDNSVATNHNNHDADPTIHVQQSVAASRPAAGSAGRIWFTSDTFDLAYDTGSVWSSVKVSAANVTAGTFGAGNYTFPGDVAITGNLTVSGAISGNGNLTLGDATTDTITFTARAVSSLLPSTNNTRDLGSAALSWRDLFSRSASFWSAALSVQSLSIGSEGGAITTYNFISDGVTTLGRADSILIGYGGTARFAANFLSTTTPQFNPITDYQGVLGNASLRWGSVRAGILYAEPSSGGTVALVLGANASTATTVGAAGGASALPATPTGYLRVTIGGTVYKLPYYAD